MFRVVKHTTEAAEALAKGEGNKCAWSLARAANTAVECLTETTTQSGGSGRSGGKSSKFVRRLNVY